MKAKQRMRLEIKELAPDGSFEGALCTYGNVDLGGDVVEAGAFTKTIKEHGDKVPLLWQHRTDEPIGDLTLVDGPDALRVKGQLLMELPIAQKAYLLTKARIVKGLSIGFDTVKEVVEGSVRHLKEIRLWEGSIVTFPMNELALITSVKAFEHKDDFSTEFAEIQLQEQGYQMWSALRNALCSIPWASEMTRDEKLTAAEVTLQQFTGAWMAYLPLFLDWLAEEYSEMESMGRRKPVEKKAGRKLSSATLKTLATANKHATDAGDNAKKASDYLLALLEEEADEEDDPEDTSKTAAVSATKSEPDPLHSGLSSLLDQARESFLWTR